MGQHLDVIPGGAALAEGTPAPSPPAPTELGPEEYSGPLKLDNPYAHLGVLDANAKAQEQAPPAPPAPTTPPEPTPLQVQDPVMPQEVAPPPPSDGWVPPTQEQYEAEQSKMSLYQAIVGDTLTGSLATPPVAAAPPAPAVAGGQAPASVPADMSDPMAPMGYTNVPRITEEQQEEWERVGDFNSLCKAMNARDDAAEHNMKAMAHNNALNYASVVNEAIKEQLPMALGVQSFFEKFPELRIPQLKEHVLRHADVLARSNPGISASDIPALLEIQLKPLVDQVREIQKNHVSAGGQHRNQAPGPLPGVQAPPPRSGGPLGSNSPQEATTESEIDRLQRNVKRY